MRRLLIAVGLLVAAGLAPSHGHYVPFGFGGWLSMSGAAFGFWIVVAIACLLALFVAVMRHFQTRPRTAAA